MLPDLRSRPRFLKNLAPEWALSTSEAKEGCLKRWRAAILDLLGALGAPWDSAGSSWRSLRAVPKAKHGFMRIWRGAWASKLSVWKYACRSFATSAYNTEFSTQHPCIELSNHSKCSNMVAQMLRTLVLSVHSKIYE